VKPGLLQTAAAQSGDGEGLEVLTLGFLTGYKLPELVVEVAESGLLAGTVFRFCIGLNPRIKDPGYVARYAGLEERVKALGSRAVWSGYVPDEKLAETFASASALVLPYTECVSTSAVAALAQHFGVAVCHSRPLRPLFGAGPLEFELEVESLVAALSQARTDKSHPQKELFTSWEASAGATSDVWRELLVKNENCRSNA
jgi:glycosyltransferase involved in cell wall biosynthesis